MVSIRDCTFEGSTDYGIQLNSPQTCRISGNTIKGYSAAVNVLLAVNGTADVIGNRIEQCRTGMSLSNGTVTSEGNTIQGVRYNGIWCEANNITIRSNTVNASSYGIFAIGHGSVTIDQNVVGRCSDTGIFLEVDEGDAEIIRNTSYLNAKSGFYLYSIAQGGSMLVRQNIAYANSVFGMLYWSDSPSVNFHCNDWFGNRGGNFNHFIDSDMPSGDRSVDPMFCDIASDEVHLMAVSPLLADSAGCSWIGAFHTSCSDTIPTAALVAEFTAERELGGILVRWKLNDLGKSAAVRLERAELEDGPFVQVPVVPRVEAALMTVLDRDVTSRAYWYRLAGRVGDRTVMWVQPIHVEAVGTSRCALISVSPSPASGPVRVEFSSSDEKTVRVSVYDALGRLVASPIHGVLQAGRHAVLWPGATGQHAIAPGIYLVRFEYPGGQETKRICIVR